MKKGNLFVSILAAFTVGVTAIAPVTADAQSAASKRRQQKKNEWRNLGLGSGAVGLYGLLKGDKTLTFLGAAGALYSAHRYEQDRKSQSKMDRARAQMFSRRSFTRNGVRYVRKTKWVNGQKHYYFARR